MKQTVAETIEIEFLHRVPSDPEDIDDDCDY
jgi:hypothetical protein